MISKQLSTLKRKMLFHGGLNWCEANSEVEKIAQSDVGDKLKYQFYCNLWQESISNEEIWKNYKTSLSIKKTIFILSTSM
jgi:hypothetical protein